MSYAEDISNTRIPIDKNGNPVSLLAVLDPATNLPVTVSVSELPSGGYGLATVAAGVAKVTAATMLAPVAVTDAAAALVVDEDATRRGHLLYNSGAKTIYVGTEEAITSASGIPVAAGSTLSIDLPGTIYAGAIYAICATGETSEVRGLTYHD